MKSLRDRLKLRMQADRPEEGVSISLPVDVIEDLKEIAPLLGFTNHLSLMRTYVAEGLRSDLERLENSPVLRLTESMRKLGLTDAVIANILAEADIKRA